MAAPDRKDVRHRARSRSASRQFPLNCRTETPHAGIHHLLQQHFRHNRTGEDNADAHMKRQSMGREVVVAVTDGKLDFGPREQIFYDEFDGHRSKRVLVKIIGE